MSDSISSLDYGEQLLLRYRASGLTRKEFAEQSGISVSTLAYYVRRERSASLPVDSRPNRILPVDLVGSGEDFYRESALVCSGGIVIHLANGRTLEVQRGFDRELLCDLLAVLEANTGEERR